MNNFKKMIATGVSTIIISGAMPMNVFAAQTKDINNNDIIDEFQINNNTTEQIYINKNREVFVI